MTKYRCGTVGRAQRFPDIYELLSEIQLTDWQRPGHNEEAREKELVEVAQPVLGRYCQKATYGP